MVSPPRSLVSRMVLNELRASVKPSTRRAGVDVFIHPSLHVRQVPDVPCEVRCMSRTGAAFAGIVSPSGPRRPADQPKEQPMAGKFEVYKDKSGGYRFRLKAGNGETIASSESYKTKAGALNGV
ncbi:MAG TPA: DUF1508 domain-containing protein, partial [Arthrobacter sp.]